MNRFEGQYCAIMGVKSSDFIVCFIVVHFLVTFCETQHEASQNLALNKMAWQSSTYDSHTADKAVDGKHVAKLSEKSCTHTNKEYQPWWTVDLGAEYLVTDVMITNRGDCCSDRLEHFTIFVGDCPSDECSAGERCVQQIPSLSDGQSTLRCDEPRRGRYVTIKLNKEGELTLCEVEVYGDPVTETQTHTWRQPTRYEYKRTNDFPHGYEYNTTTDGNEYNRTTVLRHG